jgi:hypothetical protein
MVEAVLRSRRRRAVARMAVAAAGYAAMGWPVCAGAYLPGRPHRAGETSRSCSCDRIGCPAPGAHPPGGVRLLEFLGDACGGAL